MLYHHLLGNKIKAFNYQPVELLKSKCYLNKKKLTTFYKANITLVSKSDKITQKKENYRPTSLMNVNAKIPNKILVNEFRDALKGLYTNIKMILHLQINKCDTPY